MKKTLREIINHLKSAEYKRIEKALRLLEENPLEEYYRVLLKNLVLSEDGVLVTPPAYVKNNTNQPPVDYAFWQLLGMAPWNVLEELGLSPKKIKIIRFIGYESYTHHWHYMEYFPHKITSLPYVEELHASKSKFRELPESIGNWKNLTLLNVSKTPLNKLPVGLGQLTRLRNMNASYCSLKKLPDVFQDLNELESLSLNSNEIKQIPLSFKGLIRLKSLDLSFNKIQKLRFHLSTLTQLEKIDLSYNEFSELPAAITNNRTIRILGFDNNAIREIPTDIVQMQAIEILNFNNCSNLHTIPYQLQQLPNLIEMNFGRCSQLSPAPHVKFFKRPSDFEIYFNKLKRKAGLLERKKSVRKNKYETPVPPGIPAPVATNYIVRNNPVATPKKVIPKQETELDNQEMYILSLLKDSKQEARELGYTVLEMSANAALLKRVFDELYESRAPYYETRILVNERLLTILLNYEEQGLLDENFNCSVLDKLVVHSIKSELIKRLDKFSKLATLNLLLKNISFQKNLPVLHQVKDLTMEGNNKENWNWATLFPKLKVLDLEKMNSSTQHLIESHPSLEEVKLSIGAAPLLKITDCSELKRVKVSEYWRQDINMDLTILVENCFNLSYLEINTSYCKKLIVRNCPNLKELTVRKAKNLVYELDSTTMKQIESLIITDCELTACPELVKQCVSLESLNLASNSIKRLPDFLQTLTKLKSLSVALNNLKWFPEEVFSLQYLEELNLSLNRELKVRWQYPAIYQEGFKGLIHLKKLRLSWNEAQKRKVRFMGIKYFM